MENNIKKILLVQLFSNGDCLYATAIARQIKKDYPNCELTWAIASFCKDIINLNPFVDKVRIVDNVSKNDISAFRNFKKKVKAEKKNGLWDEVFITTNMDDNQALYDGTIRGMVIRAYPKKVTVPLQPVLVLSEKEKQRVADFALLHNLSKFKNIILWEFAPQSGQANLDFSLVMKISEALTSRKENCVILSSANSFSSSDSIIDASTLTVRENAALTHFCTLMIGCSSGLTWISTSSAGKQLPMVQLLNAKTDFVNLPSVDFKRYGIVYENLIEIYEYNEKNILDCVLTILDKDFSFAKQQFDQKAYLQFNTTRKIVYNLLCYFQFYAVFNHIKISFSVYGFNLKLLSALFQSILFFPFNLIINRSRKLIHK